MLQLRFLSEEEKKVKNAEREKRKLSKKSFDANNLSKEDLEFLQSLIKRPIDHKNKKPFHFITIERDGKVFLFDGLNRFVKCFEQTESDSDLEFQRNVRLFALDIFLKSEKQNGGFLFN